MTHMPADLLRDVRDCVNRHRPIRPDYHESLRDKRERLRRTRIAKGIHDVGATIILIACFFAVQHFDRIITEYATMEEEVTELRTKVADLDSWDCRDYERGGRSFRWCSRARETK